MSQQLPKEHLKQRLDKNNPYYQLQNKVIGFKYKKGADYPLKDFDYQDVVDKFGPNPICYLTGRNLDYKKADFVLDHFIPPCCKGNNELDNLRLCDGWANMIKYTYPIPYLLRLLKRILTHHGFTVIDPNPNPYDKKIDIFTHKEII